VRPHGVKTLFSPKTWAGLDSRDEHRNEDRLVLLSTPRVSSIRERCRCRNQTLVVILGLDPLLSGLKSWTGCMTLILFVFRRFAAIWTRTGDQCHASPE
jgi:hypothetical protein